MMPTRDSNLAIRRLWTEHLFAIEVLRSELRFLGIRSCPGNCGGTSVGGYRPFWWYSPRLRTSCLEVAEFD
jgi:hypothetical protein